MTAIFPQPFSITGYATRDGNALNNQLGYPTTSSENSIIATGSGTQTSSYRITAHISRVTSVVTGADGITLPSALPGKSYVVINSGGNSMTVFGNGTDTINGTAGATGVAQSNTTIKIYFCPIMGAWFSFSSAIA